MHSKRHSNPYEVPLGFLDYGSYYFDRVQWRGRDLGNEQGFRERMEVNFRESLCLMYRCIT